jgi:xanthine dehydrogenase accessory factor
MARRVAELVDDEVPFVHAVVVRAQPPTSARPGDDAIVLADGTIEGFVGGQCAIESVRAAALDVLAGREPMLLRILPEGDPAYPDVYGARVVVNPCLSGGALEIFLEPVLPPHIVTIVGETPTADALAALADSLGFAFRSVRSLDQAGAENAVAVVVASHGHFEIESIRAALDAGVPFIGLVASHKRGEAVLDEMALDPEARARVHTPVGLPIGARTPEEIALSIIAEVLQALRTGSIKADMRGRSATGARPVPVHTVDPVCGMSVVVGPDTPHRVVGATDYWFCSPGCRDGFTG